MGVRTMRDLPGIGRGALALVTKQRVCSAKKGVLVVGCYDAVDCAKHEMMCLHHGMPPLHSLKPWSLFCAQNGRTIKVKNRGMAPPYIPHYFPPLTMFLPLHAEAADHQGQL